MPTLWLVIQIYDSMSEYFFINNRRYTGSKFKLLGKIKEIIEKYCPNQRSFTDIFAGTGVVSAELISHFEEININDLLYSNDIIYKSFFLKKKYSEKKLIDFKNGVNLTNINKIPDNYFSKNFGEKYYSKKDSKLIGHIRSLIKESTNFNLHEKYILLASLIYSADKASNTVGHYDAYIRNKKIFDKFEFKLIKPIKHNSKINIFREDANELAKKHYSDVVYIDPPYNSRQYSRFYHLLETLTVWDKPKLEGVALKRPTENMSDYCRISATDVFRDLILNIKCKYILVSYNNTYNSKSSSSANKIKYDDLVAILKTKGKLKIFDYKFNHFNAGKTVFDDHKEFLFLIETNEK